MRPIFKWVVSLYPDWHRKLFEAEMLWVLDCAAKERLGRGWAAFLGFALAEITGLLIGIAAAWWIKRPEPETVAFTSESETGVTRSPADEIRETEARVDQAIRAMVDAIAHHSFERARYCAREETRLRAVLRQLKEHHSERI